METILKIDKKLFSKYHPNVGFKSYFKTPSKMSRTMWFEDDTFMTIESPSTNGQMFDEVLQNSPLKDEIEILSKIIDNSRTITMWKCRPTSST